MAKNKTTWKFGHSGNPNGAPMKEWTWSGELKKAVEEMHETGVPVKSLIAKSLVNEALKGNINAFNAIVNRMEGMPKQSTDITTDGKPTLLFDITPQLLEVYSEQKNNN